jgi:hypothetical protein
MTNENPELIRTFNRGINDLLKYLDKYGEDRNMVESIRSKKSAAITFVGVETLITGSYEYINKYHEKIIARDEEFLQKAKLAELNIDDDSFVADVFELSRKTYRRANTSDKDNIYLIILNIANACICYHHLNNS